VGRPADLAVGDFNNDHNADLAVASRYGSEYFIALGRGDGTFGAARSFAMAEGPLASPLPISTATVCPTWYLATITEARSRFC